MHTPQEYRTARFTDKGLAEEKMDPYDIRKEATNRELLIWERRYVDHIEEVTPLAMSAPYMYHGECAILQLAMLHAGHVEIKREIERRGYVYVRTKPKTVHLTKN